MNIEVKLLLLLLDRRETGEGGETDRGRYNCISVLLKITELLGSLLASLCSFVAVELLYLALFALRVIDPAFRWSDCGSAM